VSATFAKELIHDDSYSFASSSDRLPDSQHRINLLLRLHEPSSNPTENFAPIGGNSGLGISGVQFEERQVMSERTGGEKRVDSKLGDDEGVF
jgi:hypothetical protein